MTQTPNNLKDLKKLLLSPSINSKLTKTMLAASLDSQKSNPKFEKLVKIKKSKQKNLASPSEELNIEYDQYSVIDNVFCTLQSKKTDKTVQRDLNNK